MKLNQALFFLLTFITTIHALALPASFESIAESGKELFKRKGGGGGGGRGGGGSVSSGSGSRGSGSSSSSSNSGSRGSGASSSTSNTGGRTSSGSGIKPSYGGGRYYGGGAMQPYSAGRRSPGGVAPYFIGGAALGVLPGLWLYGAYAYGPYGHPYTYRNTTSNQNETHPVQCLCGRYQECGCDNNTDSSYIDSVANNNTISRVANINGTDTLVVNGTLPNGTTAAGSAAGSLRQGMAEKAGMAVLAAGISCAVWLM